MSKEILSIQEVVDMLDSKPSPEIILNILIENDICCFVQRPPSIRVYAGRNGYGTFQDINRRHNQKIQYIQDSVLSSPSEIKDAFLLGLSRKTLSELKLIGKTRAVAFGKVLLPDLTNAYSMLLDYNGQYAISSAQKEVSPLGWHVFSDDISISISDLLIMGKDGSVLKRAYFNYYVRDSLRVANPVVSILNFVSYDFYKNNPNREYDRDVISEMILKEAVGEVKSSKNNLKNLAVIINKKYNPRQGVSNKMVRPEEVTLKEGMEAFRRDDCFSNALILVNYLVDYEKNSSSRRSKIEELAFECGLSATVSKIISTLL